MWLHLCCVMRVFCIFAFCCLGLEHIRSAPARVPVKGKRRQSETNGSGSGSGSAPQTPSERSVLSSPVTLVPQEPEQLPKRRRVPKAEEPVTPLAKGREMATKLLKKKSDAANLALTLQSVSYAEQLCSEMNSFAKRFEWSRCILRSTCFCVENIGVQIAYLSRIKKSTYPEAVVLESARACCPAEE